MFYSLNQIIKSISSYWCRTATSSFNRIKLNWNLKERKKKKKKKTINEWMNKCVARQRERAYSKKEKGWQSSLKMPNRSLHQVNLFTWNQMLHNLNSKFSFKTTVTFNTHFIQWNGKFDIFSKRKWKRVLLYYTYKRN